MNAVRDDSEGFGREHCLALMASAPVGRVVYTDRALPAVMPVTFVLDGGEVTIRTGSDATWAAAVRDAVVAFQVDEYDPVTMTGWSVTVTGRARLVGDPEAAARLDRLPLSPWIRVPGAEYVRIPATRVSGAPLGRTPVIPEAGETVA